MAKKGDYDAMKAAVDRELRELAAAARSSVARVADAAADCAGVRVRELEAALAESERRVAEIERDHRELAAKYAHAQSRLRAWEKTEQEDEDKGARAKGAAAEKRRRTREEPAEASGIPTHRVDVVSFPVLTRHREQRKMGEEACRRDIHDIRTHSRFPFVHATRIP